MNSGKHKLRQLTFPDDATLARRMGVGLLGIGALHFLAPKPFDDLIPEELPGNPRAYTYGSGVVELAVGGALLAPRTRRFAGLFSVLLFIGVYPGNINMVRIYRNKPLPYRLVAWARLPFQFPMVWAGWRVWKTAPKV
ncbi:hypothetical protein [Williamsia sp. DF01-3]|uniref:DoxX family protein n=1 Tax=Williamsia sp. DF01-3 TaxID=2934157 RepID=UPI001FF1E28B|nr:hypothetical protein [Williamsia sp. DF01-3]MCK0519639.1 hypothetical protein [Williamsia sp. DF01-3]